MKFVAKIFNSRFPNDFPNGTYEATEYNTDTQLIWVWHNGKGTTFDCDATHEDCEASVHLSTGMLDVNGTEILDIDVLIDKQKEKWKVLYSGFAWLIDSISVVRYVPTTLTPELAATLEVVNETRSEK